MVLYGYEKSNRLKQIRSNCCGFALLERVTSICSFSHALCLHTTVVEMTNEREQYEKRIIFIKKQGSICRYIGGKLNKKCLSIFAKNLFNQSSYVYEFPDGSSEHSLCSICFKAILRKIEQNMQ